MKRIILSAVLALSITNSQVCHAQTRDVLQTIGNTLIVSTTLTGAYAVASGCNYLYYTFILPRKFDNEITKYNMCQGDISADEATELARAYHANVSPSDAYYYYCYIAYEKYLTSSINKLYLSLIWYSGEHVRKKTWDLIELLKHIKLGLIGSDEYINQNVAYTLAQNQS